MKFRTLALLWFALSFMHRLMGARFGFGYCYVGFDDQWIGWWYVPQSNVQLHELLLLSVLVLMPLGDRLSSRKHRKRSIEMLEVTAAVCAGISLMMRPGLPMSQFGATPAVLLVLPWLWVRVWVAWHALVRRYSADPVGVGGYCLRCARIFPAIGAAWLVVNRAGISPWGFDPLIVLLTAAHFHHAGFTLPLMAGLNAKARPGRWTRFSCVAVLTGVPVVAIGITCTHFGVLPSVEPFGVTLLVLGALGVAGSQIQRGLDREQERNSLGQLGFVVSGASLFVAMLLALTFGLRYVFPQFALTMPQMWEIHGTLNAFGFGLCGILAWKSAVKVTET